jgi:hypothetical protein
MLIAILVAVSEERLLFDKWKQHFGKGQQPQKRIFSIVVHVAEILNFHSRPPRPGSDGELKQNISKFRIIRFLGFFGLRVSHCDQF